MLVINNIKKHFCFALSFLCAISFIGCSSSVDPEIEAVEVTQSEPQEEELSFDDLAKNKLGLEFIDDVIYDNCLYYTIEWQRSLVGNTYLFYGVPDDICQSKDQILLMAEIEWESPIFISITQEQYDKIISAEKNALETVLEIEITDVSSLPVSIYADADYDCYEDENVDGEKITIIDGIYPYTASFLGDKLVKATCIEVYTSEDIVD